MNPVDESGFSHLRESDSFRSNPTGAVDRAVFRSKSGDSSFQELTLSYLCENPRSGSGSGLKGKGVVLEDPGRDDNDNNKWVERDFLQLSSDSKDGGSSKREQGEGANCDRNCNKKSKIETLSLSLAPPDVSFSVTAATPNCEGAARLKLSRSTQSFSNLNHNHNGSNNNTQTTYSNDFTAASLSYSYSHQHSHNPSCSLTRNSTENYEQSVGSRRGESDQIWNCGEGTNGSVHSRFKPIGDHGNGAVGPALLNRGRPLGRDSCNSLFREGGNSDSTTSFFPSELPARPNIDTLYGDAITVGRSFDNLRGLDSMEERRSLNPSRGEKIVRDVLVEPIPFIAQLFQEYPTETLESAKKYLSYMILTSERKDELVGLQNLLERRSEISKDTLSKAHKAQLEILVAVKFGLNEFVSGKVHLQKDELVEIFLCLRCQNVNCKSFLPVDDCDCKICSNKKGFCSQCMCPICYKFDCASNTCSWVGCDTCSHWSHAACALEKNFIRPGSSLKGSSGTTEMQFYCLGCGHASEMFGFVKDVFICCAKDWDLQTMLKELDCVRRIFKGSEDRKGKELYLKAADLITRLERRAMSPSDARNFITHFFTNDTLESQAAHIATKVPKPNQGGGLTDGRGPSSSSPKPSTFGAGILQGLLPYDTNNSTSRPSYLSNRHLDDENSSRKSWKKDSSDSVESIVNIKEAEARMFQKRADEARKEVDAYRQLVQVKTQKLDEEYAEKVAKLCLKETEERRRKKIEELKVVENSHTDYYNMKIRMQAEISGLLERMEATKQQWV